MLGVRQFRRWVMAPIRAGRMEVLCATLGVGCGLGGLRHQLRAVPWRSAAPPTWAQEMSQGRDLARLRRDRLVAQICWNCVCHLDCSVLKLLLQVSLVRGVNREIFCVVTYCFLNHLSISELSSRARDHPQPHQFAQGFTLQRSYKYLRPCVVVQAWLKFSVHFRNLNYSWRRIGNKGSSPLRRCLEIVTSRLLEDKFMCFHLMPHFSCAVPWPAHLLRPFWFRI